MFNYNLINPINITYRNARQNPALKPAGDEEEAKKNQTQTPLSLDENRGERRFPNGSKVQVDYTQNKINIAQILEDFKSTIAAINAPKEVSDEVNLYLGLVEGESKKEAPSRDIILSNLRNASKISDKFIEDSLKKPSTVVQDWVNALFLQNIELKSDPGFVNEAFRVQIPENKTSKTIETGAGFDKVADVTPSFNNVSASSNVQGASFNAVSSENDFENGRVNVYDIPNSRVTLNEITPIGARPVPDTSLTYSTTAPQAPLNQGQEAAVSFEKAETPVIETVSFEKTYKTEMPVASGEDFTPKTLASEASVHKISSTTSKNPDISPLSALSQEERLARRSFVRAKRIVKENGDPKSALKLYDEALQLIQNSDDLDLKAAIHFERGKVFDDFDYAELALKDYNSAVKCSDNNLKTHAHLKMGRIYDDYVMFDPAVEQYSLAIETSEAAQNPSGKTRALRYLAALFADRYDKQNTETFNALSIDAARETGNNKLLARTMMEAAENFEYVGEDTKALSAYKNAAKVLHSMKEYDLLSKNYEAASEIMDRLGNGTKAMSLLSKALQYRQKAELQTVSPV